MGRELNLSLKDLGLPKEPRQEGEGIPHGEPALPFKTDVDELSLYMGEMNCKRVEKGEKLWFEVVGSLTLDDLREFNEVRSTGKGKAPSTSIRQIRTIHHQIAQYMAQGLRNVEIAAILGVSQSRLSILSNDPAFEELKEFYQEQQHKAGVSILERINTLSTLSMEEIQDRLLDEGDKIPMAQLLKLVEITLDRSGHSPGGQTKRDSQGGISADELDRIKKQTGEKSRTKVLSRAEYIPKNEGGQDEG